MPIDQCKSRKQDQHRQQQSLHGVAHMYRKRSQLLCFLIAWGPHYRPSQLADVIRFTAQTLVRTCYMYYVQRVLFASCMCTDFIASTHVNLHTCIHAYMHAYMHTCIHAYAHTRIHAYTHTRMHACTHTRLLYTHPHTAHSYVSQWHRREARARQTWASMYICIIYNPHLGSINAPLLFYFPPQNYLFHY